MRKGKKWCSVKRRKTSKKGGCMLLINAAESKKCLTIDEGGLSSEWMWKSLGFHSKRCPQFQITYIAKVVQENEKTKDVTLNHFCLYTPTHKVSLLSEISKFHSNLCGGKLCTCIICRKWQEVIRSWMMMMASKGTSI